MWSAGIRKIIFRPKIAKSKREHPKSEDFRCFSVRWLQSGYFHFLTRNEIQHNESGSESKEFPVQLRNLAAKEGIRAKQEISELER